MTKMNQLSSSDLTRMFWKVTHYEVDDIFVKEYKQWLKRRSMSGGNTFTQQGSSEWLHDKIREYMSLPGVI
jgi:hypothetical protein